MNERRDLAHHIRLKRGLLDRRDLTSSDFSHESMKNITLGDNEDLLFDNSSCLLQPESTQGPYYVDGELIRSEIRETQKGIPLYLYIQLYDTSTCDPISGVMADIWHCNSTGVYSGIVASGNGNDNITSNLDETYLRGIQHTDTNGVAQFESIFPGHYLGRTTHVHLIVHNANHTIVRTNQTVIGSNFTAEASHVAQIYFDQDLIYQVEASAPYNTNTQALTTNANDPLLGLYAGDVDPYAGYILLGNSLEDGLMAWISLGIDPTANHHIQGSGSYLKDGAITNPVSVNWMSTPSPVPTTIKTRVLSAIPKAPDA